MCFLTSIMDHPPSLPTLNLYRSPFSPAVRPSESLTTGLFLAGLGCGLAQCDGGGLTGGDVPLQSVPLFTPDSWTSHINQICRSAHMSNQRDIWWLLHRKNCQHRTACLRYTLHHPDAFLQVSVQTLISFPLTLTAFMFFFLGVLVKCGSRGKIWRRRKSFLGQVMVCHPVWETHRVMYVTATGELALKTKPCFHLLPTIWKMRWFHTFKWFNFQMFAKKLINLRVDKKIF